MQEKTDHTSDPIAPMEAKSSESLPQGPAWRFEPKWDGFRCLAVRNEAGVRLQAKSGKPLDRYFPEIVAALEDLKPRDFILDGELLIPTGGRYSFEALQLRLHPSESRIRKLAHETPATLMLFDILRLDGKRLEDRPLCERLKTLDAFTDGFAGHPRLSRTEGTDDRTVAQGWLDGGALEGVVAKRFDEAYLRGERAMTKVKRLRTADCVVGGFRYASKGDVVGSLLLGLYNERGLLDHVGFTSGLSAADKPALTRRLESLRGESGFTGDKPGGPSRWATERSTEWTPLRPELVVEVSFDHVSGGRFRHGTRLIRFRPDKAPNQCTMEQIA